LKIRFSAHKKMYKEVFGSEDGKRILHELCNRFYVLSPTVRDEEFTEQKRLIREGMRQAVLYILHQVDYDIEKYLNERKKYKMEIVDD